MAAKSNTNPTRKDTRRTDETCEAALLSNALFDPTIIDNPHYLPHVFGTEDYRRLCECLISCHSAGLPINADSVRLESKSEELADLAEKLSTRRLPGVPAKLLERLYEVSIRYEIIKLSSKYHSLAYDESEDVNSIVENFEADALKVRPATMSTIVK